MTNRDRGIGPRRFLHQDQSQRLADDVTSSDDDYVPALDWNVVPEKQLLDSVGSRRQITRLPRRQETQILNSEAIDIFQGRHNLDHGGLFDLIRQWQLDENSMNRAIGIQLADKIEQFGETIDGRKQPFETVPHFTELWVGRSA